jgi:hypothetical protein
MATDQAGKDAGEGGDETKDGLDPTQTQSEPEVDPTTGKSDEDVWRELDAAEGEQSAEKHDDEADRSNDDTPADDEKPDEDEEAAAGKPAQGEQPTEGKDGKDSKSDEAGKDGTAKDPTAKELEELRKERERLAEENRRLAHENRSNRERVQALQRKYEAPNQRGGKPDGKKKPFADQEGKSFIEEYPEVAKPVAKEIEAVREELDELKAERQRREQAEQVSRLKRNEELVLKAHSDFYEVAGSNEFGEWLKAQPLYVQDVVRRNHAAIVDAEEAADVVGRFKAFRSSQGGETDTRQGAANGAQDGPAKGGKNGTSLADRRRLQLESSTGTRSSGPGAADGIPEDGDEEEIWKAFDRQEARDARRQRRA